MKNLKMKSWLMIGMMSIGTVVTSSMFAGDGDVITLEDNQLVNRREFKAAKLALSQIEIDKMRVDYHKEQYKLNRRADLEIAKHISVKEYRIAKADLRHDKKVVRINKQDLKWDQRVAIKTQKKEEKSAKKELRKAKWELQKDLWFGNSTEITLDSEHVDFLSNKLEKERAETEKLESDIDEIFAYLDEEIDEKF
jgi:hypothetical protein